ncbi:ERG2/sigma1 receptor-like protein [Xylariomycetidae sp. FL2044]|nr:ERG2/sigma1 receptor-like protein [Xylariomycetidae sp. FL2044]
MTRPWTYIAVLVAALSSVVYLLDRNLESFYLFDVDHIHELVKSSIATHGNNTRAVADQIISELHQKHPNHVNLKQEWFFSPHGSALGSMFIIHASITEYLIIFGSATGTAGFTGRHTADDYFYMLRGEEWAYPTGVYEREIYPPGSVHHLPRGTVKGYKLTEEAFALEYARGWIPPMMFFGFADTFTSTLDIPTIWSTTVLTAREMIGNLLLGKF